MNGVVAVFISVFVCFLSTTLVIIAGFKIIFKSFEQFYKRVIINEQITLGMLDGKDREKLKEIYLESLEEIKNEE